MGVLDALKDVLSGGGKRTLPIAMEPGESELAREVASARPGTLRSVGGDLVLTDRRLVFTPLDVHGVVELLTWGLGKTGAGDVVTDLPKKLGDLIEQKSVGALTEISRVDAGGDAKLRKPPTLVVTGTDGVRTEIGILAGRRTANISASNNEARDRLLTAIRTAVHNT